MKLLPKPRGKVSRKPVVGSEKELKTKYNYNAFKKINKSKGWSIIQEKELLYNNFAKNIIRSNPGLLKAFDEFSRQPRKERYVDPNGRFELIKVTKSILQYDQKHYYKLLHQYTRGTHIGEAYYLEVNFPKKEKFFIKEFTEKNNEQSTVGEALSLRIIESIAKEYDYKIIPPHFAVDYITRNGEKRNIIAYDFTNLLTIPDALYLKKITKSEYDKVISKFVKFRLDTNKSLSSKGCAIVDLKSHNCFIDISKKPYTVYISDTRLFTYNQNVFSGLIKKETK